MASEHENFQINANSNEIFFPPYQINEHLKNTPDAAGI